VSRLEWKRLEVKEPVSHPVRLRGDLTNRCGCDLCQFVMACLGVLLPKADCGNCGVQSWS